MLRDYQQDAHDKAIAWVKSTIDPCVLDLATGAGKSHIVAAIAATLHGMTGKRILCLAPSSELVIQNIEKYRATGNSASVFSASAGEKCLRHPVVFGTPGTVKNKIRRFSNEFCAVIIDECHGITPTVKFIIEEMKKNNPLLRIIGLSATPYRLGSGWIFSTDEDGSVMDQASDPFFFKRICKVTPRLLIDRGFLTQPIIGGIHADSYDTQNMQVNSMGKFAKEDIDRAYHGQGRKTSMIVADIVYQAQARAGVLIFAATVQHANEVMQSLPPGLSAIVTSGTLKTDRANIIKKFKARELKYLVNVAVFTTGFDAPHVDLIAILRATESVGLLQQIIGRGLRIDNDKEDCLILDYAGNIERHCPDGDIFDPQITMRKLGTCGVIPATCPQCLAVNNFIARKNDEDFNINEFGYFVDLDGNEVMTEHGAMPAHMGRRCLAAHKEGPNGEHVRCSYRWNYKPCPHCDEENDIAARYCCECKGEIVDPNEKLKAEFKALKRDPTRLQTDNLVSWDVNNVITRSGKKCVRVDYVTEYRRFSIWYHPYAEGGPLRKKYQDFFAITNGGEDMPATITYRKNPETGFYDVYGYGRPADETPEV